jgi:hypothetical protein
MSLAKVRSSANSSSTLRSDSRTPSNSRRASCSRTTRATPRGRDGEGAFLSRNLRADHWHLFAGTPGCLSEAHGVEFASGQREKIDVPLDAIIRLRVKLLTPDGKGPREAVLADPTLGVSFRPVPFARRAFRSSMRDSAGPMRARLGTMEERLRLPRRDARRRLGHPRGSRPLRSSSACPLRSRARQPDRGVRQGRGRLRDRAEKIRPLPASGRTPVVSGRGTACPSRASSVDRRGAPRSRDGRS